MSTTTPPPRDGDSWIANPEPPAEATPEHLAGAPAEAGSTRGDDMRRPINRKKKRDTDDDDDDVLRRLKDLLGQRDTDDNADDDDLRPDDHGERKSKTKRARDDDDHHDDGDPAGTAGGTPSPGPGPARRDTSGATVRDDEAPGPPPHRGPDAPPPRADGGPTVREHGSEVRSAPVNPESDLMVGDQGDAAPAPDGSSPTVGDHQMRDFDDILGDDIQEMPAASVAGGIGDPGDTVPVGDAQMDSDDWDTQSVTTASDADGTDDADAYAFGSDAADAYESTTITPDDGDQAIGDAEMSEQLD